jgi:hypothetical protein
MIKELGAVKRHKMKARSQEKIRGSMNLIDGWIERVKKERKMGSFTALFSQSQQTRHSKN